ncbi:MAG: hypothetical protein ETSY1_31075 [Candidatus Entotheonella factor]|uniref:Uncharacterized protein n=1 Tax=Entotheonella factor TaxID=1429438 RepID=W4LB96_ENTF1|nr:MAG: hypothetical protein ETSY1_31075 [Candidatus Entotheonella factor]
MQPCMYSTLTAILLLGLAALHVNAQDGTVSSDFDTIERVFCLNSTTGGSIDGAVMVEADGGYRFDCTALEGGANDAVTILIQGTLRETTAPSPSSCAQTPGGDTTLGQAPCMEDVPDNIPATAMDLFGDIYSFQANAGDLVDIRVDTVDRGDGLADLHPGLTLIGPNGMPIIDGLGTVPCSFAPACDHVGCPRISTSLPATGTYTAIIIDVPTTPDTCTGGAYTLTGDGTGGLILIGDDLLTDL